MIYLQKISKDTGPHERVMHEMIVLTESFHVEGMFDQVNIGGLVCLATLARQDLAVLPEKCLVNLLPHLLPHFKCEVRCL